MLNLFQKSPPLPEDTILWLFDAFAWSLRNFGNQEFMQHTVLVEPTDKHFPGSKNTPDSMAELILAHTKTHTGLSHWPTQAVDHHQFDRDSEAGLNIKHILEHKNDTDSEDKLIVLFEPQQIKAPEVMIANYAHALSHQLGQLASEPPPCDQELWLHLMEAVAVYLGFGVILANTADPYQGGGCARCVSPAMERKGLLTEDEITYALAIFCTLKAIPLKQAGTHLKSSLKPMLKKSFKDIENRPEEIDTLRAIHSEPGLRQFNSHTESARG